MEPPQWFLDAVKEGVIGLVFPGESDCVHLDIKTLEGVMRAGPGDWIIRGVKGEIYPCKSDIFEITYESAE